MNKKRTTGACYGDPMRNDLHPGGASACCLLILCFAWIAGGCAGTKSAALNEMVPAVSASEYVLLSGDEVGIDIFREPELSGTFRIESSGVIRHPLFGPIKLAGLRVPEAEVHLIRYLGEKYLVNPRIMLRVVASQASQLLIMGEVKKPGVHAIPFDEPVTLLQAVAVAGGFTDLASQNRVQVLRGREGRQKRIKVRVSRIVSGQEQDFRLEPNDVIVVPQILF